MSRKLTEIGSFSLSYRTIFLYSLCSGTTVHSYTNDCKTFLATLGDLFGGVVLCVEAQELRVSAILSSMTEPELKDGNLGLPFNWKWLLAAMVIAAVVGRGC